MIPRVAQEYADTIGRRRTKNQQGGQFEVVDKMYARLVARGNFFTFAHVCERRDQ
jgi:hypothetical protein